MTRHSRGGGSNRCNSSPTYRLKTQGGANKPQYYNKCTFAEGGVKGPERSIPCSKFCRRHIMQDRIGSRCSSGHVGSRRAESSVMSEREPVSMIFDDATCPLHIEMPPERSYWCKYESDGDGDDDDDHGFRGETGVDGVILRVIDES